jgi:hypothetical protein
MTEQQLDGGAVDDNTSILMEADHLVYGSRQEAYGTPLDNFSVIAQLWSVVLDTSVTPKQAALCMVQLKIARELFKSSRDNKVDAAGYLGVVALIEEEQERRDGTV